MQSLFVFGTSNWAKLLNLAIMLLPAGVLYWMGSEALALAWMAFYGGVMIPTGIGRASDVVPKLVTRNRKKKDEAPPLKDVVSGEIIEPRVRSED